MSPIQPLWAFCGIKLGRMGFDVALSHIGRRREIRPARWCRPGCSPAGCEKTARPSSLRVSRRVDSGLLRSLGETRKRGGCHRADRAQWNKKRISFYAATPLQPISGARGSGGLKKQGCLQACLKGFETAADQPGHQDGSSTGSAGKSVAGHIKEAIANLGRKPQVGLVAPRGLRKLWLAPKARRRMKAICGIPKPMATLARYRDSPSAMVAALLITSSAGW